MTNSLANSVNTKTKHHSSKPIVFRAQTGFRTTVTSKMELFVTIFDSFHSLTIVTKSLILHVASVLDPTLITDILRRRAEF